MSDALLVAVLLQSVLLTGAFLLILALARQVGALYVRIGPEPRRTLQQGPLVGTKLAQRTITDLHGNRYAIPTRGSEELFVFVSPTCQSCKDIVPGLRALARSRPTLAVKVISGAQPSPTDVEYAESISPIPYLREPEFQKELMRVEATPFAVLIDAEGMVYSKSVVNHLEDLENLFSTMVIGPGTNTLSIVGLERAGHG